MRRTSTFTIKKEKVNKPYWCVSLSHKLGSEVDQNTKNKADLLDSSEYRGVRQYVEALNNGEVNCEKGYCLVYSEAKESYFMLHRSDMALMAYEVFNIRNEDWSLTWSKDLGDNVKRLKDQVVCLD